MIKEISNIRGKVAGWINKNVGGLFMLNLVLMILVLLRSAGYFQPYFLITINLIVFVGLVLSIFLLKLDSKSIFTLGLFFWIFAAVLKVIGVGFWAERTGIYSYEAMIIGIVLIMIESLRRKK